MATDTRRRLLPYGLLVGAATILPLLMTTDVLAQGCAMCRTALGGSEDPVARGFFWSILFLMSAPYTILGSVGGWFLYRYLRRARDENGPGMAYGEEPGGRTS